MRTSVLLSLLATLALANSVDAQTAVLPSPNASNTTSGDRTIEHLDSASRALLTRRAREYFRTPDGEYWDFSGYRTYRSVVAKAVRQVAIKSTRSGNGWRESTTVGHGWNVADSPDAKAWRIDSVPAYLPWNPTDLPPLWWRYNGTGEERAPAPFIYCDMDDLVPWHDAEKMPRTRVLEDRGENVVRISVSPTPDVVGGGASPWVLLPEKPVLKNGSLTGEFVLWPDDSVRVPGLRPSETKGQTYRYITARALVPTPEDLLEAIKLGKAALIERSYRRERDNFIWQRRKLELKWLPQKNSTDTITLLGGGSLDCTVVQEDADTVTVIFGTGLLTLPRAEITNIWKTGNRTPDTKPTKVDGPAQTSPAQRLPPWPRVVTRAAGLEWAKSFRQIPATVIDRGVMRHVPYKSHRCATHYEINVYGAPDNPAAFEVGVTGPLLDDPQAKQRCVSLVASLLQDPADAAIVRGLKVTEDRIERDGLTFEITPPTAPDAYGGWWVSVYAEGVLDRERASEQELREITTPLTTAKEPQTAPPSSPKPPTGNLPVTQPDQSEDRIEGLQSWSEEDLGRARQVPSTTSSSSSAGKSVYVRGYHRKDGTYVRPHYRSRPKR